jgi:predicted Zn-dependent protease
MKRVIGLAGLGCIAIFGFIYFFFQKDEINPATGRKQHVSMAPEREVSLGLQSAPELASKFGGLDRDREIQSRVNKIGRKLVVASDTGKLPFQFDFHVLADQKTIDAFALPGGQIFITKALLMRLKSDDELAIILGHEIGHVVARHASEKISERGFKAIIAAIGFGEKASGAEEEAFIANFLKLRYDAEDETEADRLAIKYVIAAGYKPDQFLEVMKIAKQPGGGFVQTHIDNLKELMF